jgi:hypothetical protein
MPAKGCQDAAFCTLHTLHKAAAFHEVTKSGVEAQNSQTRSHPSHGAERRLDPSM